MATEKQIAANRRNAQLSTGPRTEAGKQNSSHNSLRHGLAAQGFIVTEEQQDSFTHLQNSLRTFLSPNGPVQGLLFQQVLAAAWNIHRCNLAEANLFWETGIDPLVDDQNEPKYDRIRRYARQAESSLHRAMRELGNLQTEAAFRKRAFPITREERSNPEVFFTTPHAESDLCRTHKVMDMVKRHAPVQNEPNLPQPDSPAPEAEPPASETKPITEEEAGDILSFIQTLLAPEPTPASNPQEPCPTAHGRDGAS